MQVRISFFMLSIRLLVSILTRSPCTTSDCSAKTSHSLVDLPRANSATDSASTSYRRDRGMAMGRARSVKMSYQLKGPVHRPVRQNPPSSPKLPNRPQRQTGGRLQERDSTVGSDSFDVYSISDLHTDHKLNLEWVRSLPIDRYNRDVLIVAGDISDNIRTLSLTLNLLLKRFRKVAFVPGNHELWVCDFFGRGYPPGTDSIKKLEMVMGLCRKLGVIVDPTRIDNLVLVPTLAWHHTSFDIEPDTPNFNKRYKKLVSDYKFCKWTSLSDEHQIPGSYQLARYLDELNPWFNPKYREMCDVISFSHFAPRHELIPEKKFLTSSYLTKIAGSRVLMERLNRLKPNIHVFGHTHIAWDASIDGIRYVQAPLGNPRERRGRPGSLVVSHTIKDPRLRSREWPAPKWTAMAAEWLPYKIYTYNPRKAKLSEDGIAAGIMHKGYAQWSEYYKHFDRN